MPGEIIPPPMRGGSTMWALQIVIKFTIESAYLGQEHDLQTNNTRKSCIAITSTSIDFSSEETRFQAVAVIVTTPSGSYRSGSEIKQSHRPVVLGRGAALQHGIPL